MQLVTSAPPVLSDEEAAELQEVLDREAFNARHLNGVLRDFRIAQRHAKNGTYRLIVTPASRVIRQQYMSTVRVDLTNETCREIQWLKSLYKENKPAGVSVECHPAIKLLAECHDHLENIHVLEVKFTITTSKKKLDVFRKRTA